MNHPTVRTVPARRWPAGQRRPALSAGDAKRGMNTFAEECGVCHSPKQGKAKLGPPLFGVVGRAAAAAPDFTYSDAMRQSGE